MQIGQHHQARARRQRGGGRVGIQPPAVLWTPIELAQVGLEISQGRGQQLIGRILDQHLVAGREQRGHGQVVGERAAAARDDHAGWIQPEPGRDRIDQRGVAIGVVAVQLQVG